MEHLGCVLHSYHQRTISLETQREAVMGGRIPLAKELKNYKDCGTLEKVGHSSSSSSIPCHGVGFEFWGGG
jgi:hypothetical protein